MPALYQIDGSHTNTHIFSETLTHLPYLLMFVVQVSVISVQIKALFVGWPDSLAFINWSTFIQLLSPLSRLPTQAV